MKIKTKTMLFLVVGFLLSGDVFAFTDTNAFVVRITRCLPKNVKIFSAHDFSREQWITTGECFRVSVYMEEFYGVLPGKRLMMRSGVPSGVWVCFLSERYRPENFPHLRYRTQIPITSSPDYDVILMTAERPYSWFLDPIWQEFYERLKKEFAVVPIVAKEGP